MGDLSNPLRDRERKEWAKRQWLCYTLILTRFLSLSLSLSLSESNVENFYSLILFHLICTVSPFSSPFLFWCSSFFFFGFPFKLETIIGIFVTVWTKPSLYLPLFLLGFLYFGLKWLLNGVLVGLSVCVLFIYLWFGFVFVNWEGTFFC